MLQLRLSLIPGISKLSRHRFRCFPLGITGPETPSRAQLPRNNLLAKTSAPTAIAACKLTLLVAIMQSVPRCIQRLANPGTPKIVNRRLRFLQLPTQSHVRTLGFSQVPPPTSGTVDREAVPTAAVVYDQRNDLNGDQFARDPRSGTAFITTAYVITPLPKAGDENLFPCPNQDTARERLRVALESLSEVLRAGQAACTRSRVLAILHESLIGVYVLSPGSNNRERAFNYARITETINGSSNIWIRLHNYFDFFGMESCSCQGVCFTEFPLLCGKFGGAIR